MTSSDYECPIWRGHHARHLGAIEGKLAWRVDSPRAGGEYHITELAKSQLDATSIDARARARLTTRLIDHRKETGRPLMVSQAHLEEAGFGRDLEVPERLHRLLAWLVGSSSTVGKEVCLMAGPKVGIGPEATASLPYALAVSESTADDEIRFLCDELVEKEWIRPTRSPNTFSHFRVTGRGYEAARNPRLPDSEQGFVAMWLDESMDEVYENGLRPAIEDAGYKAVRIDREPSVDKIDDAILAGIRQSRFVVADFTHGADGARGSVYFEVGFARGRGIEVISTCREDQVDSLHFDTRQYYHIAWKPDDLDQLRREASDRILARVGAAAPGPRHTDS